MWLGGARQTRFRVGKLQIEGVPPNFEKTVSKHVTGNHEYSIYNLRQQRILASPTLISFG